MPLNKETKLKSTRTATVAFCYVRHRTIFIIFLFYYIKMLPKIFPEKYLLNNSNLSAWRRLHWQPPHLLKHLWLFQVPSRFHDWDAFNSNKMKSFAWRLAARMSRVSQTLADLCWSKGHWSSSQVDQVSIQFHISIVWTRPRISFPRQFGF